jgi:hypothetical protein
MELSRQEQEAILEAAWCPVCLKSTPFEVLGGDWSGVGWRSRGGASDVVEKSVVWSSGRVPARRVDHLTGR